MNTKSSSPLCTLGETTVLHPLDLISIRVFALIQAVIEQDKMILIINYK